MAEYLYCRVSTDSQSTDGQTKVLTRKYPNVLLVAEIVSGAKLRPELSSLMSRMVAGDTIIVAAFDRLGRNVLDLLTMIQDLERRGISMVFERRI